MNDAMTFPSLEDNPARVHDWLDLMENVFECARPGVDLVAVLQQVMRLALGHGDAEVRTSAYLVLSKGLVNHPAASISLRPVAERLPDLAGKELLWALNAVGMSGDATLEAHLTPLLTHEDRYVRAEAYTALLALGLSPPTTHLRG